MISPQERPPSLHYSKFYKGAFPLSEIHNVLSLNFSHLCSHSHTLRYTLGPIQLSLFIHSFPFLQSPWSFPSIIKYLSHILNQVQDILFTCIQTYINTFSKRSNIFTPLKQEPLSPWFSRYSPVILSPPLRQPFVKKGSLTTTSQNVSTSCQQ